MKYIVEIKEELTKLIEVEAADKNEAILKVEKQYKNEDVVLYPEDFMSVEFGVFSLK